MDKEQERAELERAVARWLKDNQITVLPPVPESVRLDRVAITISKARTSGQTKTSHYDGWENVTKF